MAVTTQILLLCVSVVVKCQSHFGNQKHHIQDNVNPLLSIIEKFEANNELITGSLKGASEGLLDLNLKPLDFSGSTLLGLGWLSHSGNINQISEIEDGWKYNKDKNYVEDNFGNNPQDSLSEKGLLSKSKSTRQLESNIRQPSDQENPSNEFENNNTYNSLREQGVPPNKENYVNISPDKKKQGQENLDTYNNLSPLPINLYVDGNGEKNVLGKFNSINDIGQTNRAEGVKFQQKIPLISDILDREESNIKNNQNNYDENTRVSNGVKFKSIEDKTDDSVPKSVSNSDKILEGTLILNQELTVPTNNNENNIEIKRNKDFITFPNESNENNVNNKVIQPFESQPAKIQNRLGNGSNQYFSDKMNPPKRASGNVPAMVTSPNEAMINNFPNNQPISSNAQNVPQSKINYQNTAGQNRYSGNQGLDYLVNDQGPYSQSPVNNVLSYENGSPSSNIVMNDANNGMLNSYIPVTVSDDRNSENNINYPIFVIKNRPVSSMGPTINGDYYNARNTRQQYYIIQLSNGQTVLMPVSINQFPRQANTLTDNNGQPNVQNNGQYQYVPANNQNIVQVPVNNQPLVQLPAQIMQTPSNGQVMYQVIGPNNPQRNAMTYSTPIQMMPVGPLNSNSIPMMISYKNREANVKSDENAVKTEDTLPVERSKV